MLQSSYLVYNTFKSEEITAKSYCQNYQAGTAPCIYFSEFEETNGIDWVGSDSSLVLVREASFFNLWLLYAATPAMAAIKLKRITEYYICVCVHYSNISGQAQL